MKPVHDIPVPQVYRDAADLIAERGKAEGTFISEGGCLSALSAICVAMGLSPTFPADAADEFGRLTEIAAAGTAGRRFAQVIVPLLMHLGLRTDPADLVAVVARVAFLWSDRHPAEYVIAELRAVADGLEGGAS